MSGKDRQDMQEEEKRLETLRSTEAELGLETP